MEHHISMSQEGLPYPEVRGRPVALLRRSEPVGLSLVPVRHGERVYRRTERDKGVVR
jgi:hypothetical protein